MLQLQYYNSNLKNNHINKILNNYRLKYSQVKLEIESKLNHMMKNFLSDILTFLENIEEVAEHRRKINEYDTLKKELELAQAKIKNKVYNEHKLKNECDILLQENSMLKLKIKSLNNKIFVLSNSSQYNSHNSKNHTPKRKRSNNSLSTRNNNSLSKKSNYNYYMSPKSEVDKNLSSSIVEENIPINKSISSFASPKNESINNSKIKKKIDKVNIRLNYDKSVKQIKSKNLFFKSKKKKKVNIHKYVNNNQIIKNINKDKKNINLKKFNIKKEEENLLTRSGPINYKKNLNRSLENRNVNTNRYSPINTTNTMEIPYATINIDYEDLGKKINTAIDDELKELEKDEENLELLLEQLIDDDNIGSDNDS